MSHTHHALPIADATRRFFLQRSGFVTLALALMTSTSACVRSQVTDSASDLAAQTQESDAGSDFEVETGPPDQGKPRGKALAAVEDAQDLVLYSLRPREYMMSPDSEFEYGTPQYEADVKPKIAAWEKEQEELCKDGRCLYRNPVLGKVAVNDAIDVQLLKDVLQESLGIVPNYATACVAEYRHAIAFMSNGNHYEVLLCYGCGQVSVAVNGELDGDGQTYKMGGERALDAILSRARIPLAPKPER